MRLPRHVHLRRAIAGVGLCGKSGQQNQGADAVRHPLLRAHPAAGENGRRRQRPPRRPGARRYHRLYAQRAGRRGQQELWPGGSRAGGGAERGDQARAQKLRELESISPNAAATQVDGTQMSLLAAPEETSPAVEALENLDPDSLTPRQALEWIYRLKSLV